MRKLNPLVVIPALFAFLLPAAVHAADATLLELLTILRERGSISESEYELLRDSALEESAVEERAASQAREEVAAVREEVEQASAPAEWTSRIAFDGDMRVRYSVFTEDGKPSDRARGRLRYRLGLVADPAEGWQVGAGLASGTGDLRSANQTFDDTFSAKNVNLDYAYAQYSFDERLKIIGGKFKHGDYLFKASNLFLDDDVNPEGISANFTTPNGLGAAFANSGYWVLEENSDSDDDPYLAFLQLGQQFSAGDWFGTLAGTWYSFEDMNALGDIKTDGTNTDFRFAGIFSLSAELGLNNVFDSGTRISVFSDLIRNEDTDTGGNSGYSMGLEVSRDRWEFGYIYGKLEENAFPDILPDSDRFDGLTGIDGHEFLVDFALTENVTIGLDYYDVEREGVNQTLFQFDTVVSY